MYVLYAILMSAPKKPIDPASRDSLSVELGGWFKANATGRGVFVIAVILLALGALGFAQAWFGLPA